MKNNRRGFIGRAIVVFCLFMAVPVFAFGDDGNIAGEDANVIFIRGPQWSENRLRVLGLAPDTKARLTDASIGDAGTATLPYGGTAIVENFGPFVLRDGGTPHVLPDGTQIGVAQLRVVSGRAVYAVEAIYRDVRGVSNVVRLPALPPAIDGRHYSTPETWSGALYEFRDVDNGSFGKTAYLALITKTPGQKARVKLTVYDARHVEIATESVTFDGFAFYVLRTAIAGGTIVMESESIVVSPPLSPTPVYAVAFSGFAEGGAPDVIVPRRLPLAVALPLTVRR